MREKLTRLLRDELPYALTVEVDRFQQQDDIFHIDATIWVERSSQKGIVMAAAAVCCAKRVGWRARICSASSIAGYTCGPGSKYGATGLMMTGPCNLWAIEPKPTRRSHPRSAPGQADRDVAVDRMLRKTARWKSSSVRHVPGPPLC